MAAILKCALISGIGACFAIPSLLNAKNWNNFYELVDISKISETKPILDCEQHGRHYQIYLTAKEGGPWTISGAQESITMSVFDAKSSNLSWGGTRQTNGEQWSNWRLRVTAGNKVSLEIPQTFGFTEDGYISLTCKDSKISPKSLDSGGELVISVNSSTNSGSQAIKFKIQNDSSCQSSGTWKECEISFDDSNNLVWKNGFKPKAYFYL